MAIKFLPPDPSPELVRRFKREANLLAHVTHQNLVRIFYRRYWSGLHYLVMEYVCGDNAGQRVKERGPMKLAEAITVTLHATRGLAAMHHRGIVHRDVKPENIFMSTEGEVKLGDLGLSRWGEGNESLTQPGTTLGTPLYMPPEQWKDSSHVGCSSDVWAMGTTLYFLCAGRPPYRGNAHEVMSQVLNKPFPDLSGEVKDIPPTLSEILRRCTEREPAKRYPTAMPLVADLERLAREQNYEAFSFDNEQIAPCPPPPIIPREILETAKKAFAEQRAQVHFPRENSHTVFEADRKDVRLGETKKERGKKSPRRGMAWVGGFLFLVALGGSFYYYSYTILPWWLNKQGLAALGASRHEEAAEKFKTLLQVDPDFPRAKYWLAEALYHAADNRLKNEALGEAYDLAREASRYDRSSARQKLLETIREKIKSRLEDSLHLQSAGTQSYWSPTFSLSGTVYMQSLRRAGLMPVEVRVDGESVGLTAGGKFERSFQNLPNGPKTIDCDVVFRDLSVEKTHKVFVNASIVFEGVNSKGLEEYRHRRSRVLMVLLPEGRFRMGSPAEDKESRPDEQPAHDVFLSTFLIAKYEVTQEEWARVIPKTSGAPLSQQVANQPQGGLSWGSCKAFCDTAGLSFPTEAQWEYACRAGTTTEYAYGDRVTPRQVHSGEDLPVEDQKSVAVNDPRFPANRFGLHHMHGNIYEWCEDVYDSYRRSPVPVRDPRCDEIDGLQESDWTRVLRGGSYSKDPERCRSARRWTERPDTSQEDFGFRPVYNLTPRE